MNIKYTISIFASLLLLLLTGCSQERLNAPEENMPRGENELRLIVHAPEADPSLKAALIETEGSLDLQARFREGDQVALYAVQNDVVISIGTVPFKYLAEDGSEATVDFTLPAEVDASAPFTLIGYSGLNQSRITLVDNKLEVLVDNFTANSQERFNIPVILRAENFSAEQAALEDVSVRFQHIGCYEIVHLTNNTTEEISADYVGLSDASAYSVSRSWTYNYGYDRSVGASVAPYYNLVDGSINMKEGYPRGDFTVAPKIAPGETVSVFSWYIPKEVGRPEMVLNMRDAKTRNNIKSQEVIPANPTPMEVGKAYHAYGKWDGSKLTLTGSTGEAKPIPYIKVTTEIPAGNMIEVLAYVSYGNRASSFVDLNGNGIQDGALEACPSSSFRAQPYMVDQPEITFYGKFESLALSGQKITAVEISPAALPTELDFTNNNLSTEALNALFEQLPDINHIEPSIFDTKKLSIKDNPGTEDCNAKVAIDKGWILDILIIDESQPSIYLVMDGYAISHDLYFNLDAAPEDRDNVWMDLNGNGAMDEGEKIDTFDMKMQKKVWAKDELLIYGNITKLDIAGNGTIFAMANINNTTLTHLNASGNGMAAILLEKFDKLEYLNVADNALMVDFISFDPSHLATMKALNIANCGVKELDISKMSDLSYLNIEGNKLTSIGVADKTKLRTLIATSNQLSELTIGSQVIRHLELGGNLFKADVLNSIITALPDRSAEAAPGGLWIAENPGTGLAQVKVALDKNWNVDTKNLKAGNTGNRPDMDGEDW